MKLNLVNVSQTMSKTVKVITEDTVNDWKKAFEEEHWDLKSLLKVLQEYVKLDMCKHITDRSARQLEVIAIACSTWHEDNYVVNKIKDGISENSNTI